MAFTTLTSKIWTPPWTWAMGNAASFPPSASDQLLLDADGEEGQFIGRVYLAAGSGTKTFGGGSSAIGWLPGATITFAANSTLRVGMKSAIDGASGPPPRATHGTAAFGAYTDLVGGTATITSTTWRSDTIGSGTPFSVTHGDLMAVCFHLTVTSGSPSVKVRGVSLSTSTTVPASVLITAAGATFTTVATVANARITFSDGTIGWIDGSWTHSVGVTAETVGSTNIYGNVFRLPFRYKVDALLGFLSYGGTTNQTLGFWSTPLGTPAAISGGTVTIDPQTMSTGIGPGIITLPAPITLEANTDYLVGALQNGATAHQIEYFDVDAVGDMMASGMDSTCYAAKSTAGATASAQNSGKRRAGFFARISDIEFSTSGGGSGVVGS